MPDFTHLDAADRAAFERDGYVFKRGMFTAAEVALCNRVIATDPAIQGSRLKVTDTRRAARPSSPCGNYQGDDVFGMIARCGRVAGGAEALLGVEAYHYHSKLTMKRPGGGGRWEWHQDYGYWYQNGCLWPDMLSVAVALELATRENGCMQVLKGSHKLGRIQHGRVAGQTGADPERVEQGARSGWNSSFARWRRATRCSSTPTRCTAPLPTISTKAAICCSAATIRRATIPTRPTIIPATPSSRKVPDEAVLAAGDRVAHAQGRWFLEEGKDETTEAPRQGRLKRGPRRLPQRLIPPRRS